MRPYPLPLGPGAGPGPVLVRSGPHSYRDSFLCLGPGPWVWTRFVSGGVQGEAFLWFCGLGGRREPQEAPEARPRNGFSHLWGVPSQPQEAADAASREWQTRLLAKKATAVDQAAVDKQALGSDPNGRTPKFLASDGCGLGLKLCDLLPAQRGEGHDMCLKARCRRAEGWHRTARRASSGLQAVSSFVCIVWRMARFCEQRHEEE